MRSPSAAWVGGTLLGGAARGLPGVVVREEFAVSVGLPRRSASEPGKVAGAREARGAGPSAGPGLGWGRARGLGLSLPLLLGQLLALMGDGGAFYLEVRELEEKCFIQEIPDGTMVIGARAASPGLALLASPRLLRHLSPTPVVGAGGEWVDHTLPKHPLPFPGLGAPGR